MTLSALFEKLPVVSPPRFFCKKMRVLKNDEAVFIQKAGILFFKKIYLQAFDKIVKERKKKTTTTTKKKKKIKNKKIKKKENVALNFFMFSRLGEVGTKKNSALRGTENYSCKKKKKK